MNGVAHIEEGDAKEAEVKETKGSEAGGKKDKKGKENGAKGEPSQDFEFPYKLASKWNVWYDRPGSKKVPREAYNTTMKQIYQFNSVKAFWGLYNHLNLDKMPVGANLRIFKSDIQPTWEDPANKDGGNWILVPRPRDVAAILVFKELLLSMIGGDLDPLVNGIVLSIKAKDIIIQMWCPSNKTKRREKVQDVAMVALNQYCPKLVQPGPGKVNPLEWTWRAHPTATLTPVKKKSVSEGGEEDNLPGETGGAANRGSCGECMGRWNACTIQ